MTLIKYFSVLYTLIAVLSVFVFNIEVITLVRLMALLSIIEGCLGIYLKQIWWSSDVGFIHFKDKGAYIYSIILIIIGIAIEILTFTSFYEPFINFLR